MVRLRTDRPRPYRIARARAARSARGRAVRGVRRRTLRHTCRGAPPPDSPEPRPAPRWQRPTADGGGPVRPPPWRMPAAGRDGEAERDGEHHPRTAVTALPLAVLPVERARVHGPAPALGVHDSHRADPAPGVEPAVDRGGGGKEKDIHTLWRKQRRFRCQEASRADREIRSDPALAFPVALAIAAPLATAVPHGDSGLTTAVEPHRHPGQGDPTRREHAGERILPSTDDPDVPSRPRSDQPHDLHAHPGGPTQYLPGASQPRGADPHRPPPHPLPRPTCNHTDFPGPGPSRQTPCRAARAPIRNMPRTALGIRLPPRQPRKARRHVVHLHPEPALPSQSSCTMTCRPRPAYTQAQTALVAASETSKTASSAEPAPPPTDARAASQQAQTQTGSGGRLKEKPVAQSGAPGGARHMRAPGRRGTLPGPRWPCRPRATALRAGALPSDGTGGAPGDHVRSPHRPHPLTHRRPGRAPVRCRPERGFRSASARGAHEQVDDRSNMTADAPWGAAAACPSSHFAFISSHSARGTVGAVTFK